MHKLRMEAAASPASDSDFEPVPGLLQQGRKLHSAGPEAFYRLGDPQPASSGLPEGDPSKLKDVASSFIEERHLSVDDENKSEAG